MLANMDLLLLTQLSIYMLAHSEYGDRDRQASTSPGAFTGASQQMILKMMHESRLPTSSRSSPFDFEARAYPEYLIEAKARTGTISGCLSPRDARSVRPRGRPKIVKPQLYYFRRNPRREARKGDLQVFC